MLKISLGASVLLNIILIFYIRQCKDFKHFQESVEDKEIFLEFFS